MVKKKVSLLDPDPHSECRSRRAPSREGAFFTVSAIFSKVYLNLIEFLNILHFYKVSKVTPQFCKAGFISALRNNNMRIHSPNFHRDVRKWPKSC